MRMTNYKVNRNALDEEINFWKIVNKNNGWIYINELPINYATYYAIIEAVKGKQPWNGKLGIIAKQDSRVYQVNCTIDKHVFTFLCYRKIPKGPIAIYENNIYGIWEAIVNQELNVDGILLVTDAKEKKEE